MGIQSVIPNATFSQVKATSNASYAQLLFNCLAHSGGLTGVPEKPNLRVTVESGDSLVGRFKPGVAYNLKVDVTASQPNQKYTRASVNYAIVDATEAK